LIWLVQLRKNIETTSTRGMNCQDMKREKEKSKGEGRGDQGEEEK